MSVNKKIKKYVASVSVPEAKNVLPENCQSHKKKKIFKPYYFAPVGAAAAAGIIAAVTMNMNNARERKGAIENTAFVDGVIGEKITEASGDDFHYSIDKMDGAVKEDMFSESVDGSFGASGENNIVTSGMLTGGEIKDLYNWNNWLNVCNKAVIEKWNLSVINRYDVYLHNNDVPLNNINVRLLAGDTIAYESVSNVSGNAFLLYNVNTNEDGLTPDKIEIENENGGYDIYDISQYADSNNHMEINLDGRSNEEIKLDLMFVVDTTGSMGDELEFLQAELKDVIDRVEDETGVPIRTSVNFYRDEEDEYVVKYYDFREEEEEIEKILMEQTADGGGDYEEAVHTALDNAINDHEWSEDSTVKLMFLVLDAPPHNTDEISTQLRELMIKASREGIRVIPVVASGADEDTVQLLRAYAIMTGGTYVFLDDNSGIGYSHTVPVDKNEYNSEYLNSMLIRIIGEYCGEEISSEPVPEKPTETETQFQQ